MDNEIPELLSDEQLDRYLETVAELLRAAGLDVETDPEDPNRLEARAPGGSVQLEVDIREDRSAEWSLTGGDESGPGTRALSLAATLAGVLEPNREASEG